MDVVRAKHSSDDIHNHLSAWPRTKVFDYSSSVARSQFSLRPSTGSGLSLNGKGSKVLVWNFHNFLTYTAWDEKAGGVPIGHEYLSDPCWD